MEMILICQSVQHKEKHEMNLNVDEITKERKNKLGIERILTSVEVTKRNCFFSSQWETVEIPKNIARLIVSKCFHFTL